MNTIIAILIVQSVVCGFIGHIIYEKDVGGFFLGFLLGVFGVIIAAILSLNPEYKEWKKEQVNNTKNTIKFPEIDKPVVFKEDDFTERMMVEQDKKIYMVDPSGYTKRQRIDMEIERRYGKR